MRRILLSSLIAALSSPALAVGPTPGVNVTVTNSPSQPVPVTIGNGISGTVTATQGGNWNVGVINSSTDPVVVKDVTPLKPFAVGGDPIVATVPAGKIYVIEHWNLRCDVGASGSMTDVTLTSHVDGVTVQDSAVPHFIGPNGTVGGAPVNQWAGSGHPTIRVMAGSTFALDASATAPRTNCSGSISGYSVDID